jgi:hypothetical protein
MPVLVCLHFGLYNIASDQFLRESPWAFYAHRRINYAPDIPQGCEW